MCGIDGSNDVQFPMALLEEFQQALNDAKVVGVGVEHDVRIYYVVRHVFWKDMEQVHQGNPPQVAEAYQ
jgi:hypothetical protein